MKSIIDISSNTTITNYDALKQYDGVYIKATEGGDYISQMLDIQVKACIARNIPFGLYHFAGKVHTPQEEYTFFKSICDKYPQRLLPDCLDYEQSDENIQWVSDFMKLDCNLIFYSYRNIVNKAITYFLPKNKIWVAIPATNGFSNVDLNGFLGVQYLLSYTPPNQNAIINCDVSIFDDSILSKVQINNIKEVLGMKNIQKGESSQRVLLLQMLLNLINNAKLTTDGVFGDKTLFAVRVYQSKKGLTPDGTVGTNTKTMLLNDINNALSN